MTLQAIKARLEGRLEASDVTIETGKLIALVGPNGSGKTSLLRTLAAIAGTAEALTVDGRPLNGFAPAERARTLSYLPSSLQLHWPIPVADLLRLSPVAIDEQRVDELVEQLELQSFLDRPSNALSTGERARVLLARALANRPKLLLLDEPLANLDPYWVLKIVDLLRQEAAHGVAIVAALHDLAQLDAFDRCILMDQGRIIADGPCKKVAGEDIFAATFRLRKRQTGWTL
ncbi:ABC transporter ATP-binding protein [Sphingomicrobium flavum]|uniref:ABC transporter ATP-binding protein n=1 Tax=Sphingomicrobium flavum TaxID=1229164 RepID=UPI0021AD5420|nr:ABC transporter ATP-binding protein [Sphingomicrobium flavum]